MGNVQVRLPDDLERQLDELAKEIHGSRSDAIRHALHDGLRHHRIERSLDQYAKGAWTLARAAQECGLSIHALAMMAAQRGTPYFRYSGTELDEDVAAAEDAL